jgi:hypothetical protein
MKTAAVISHESRTWLVELPPVSSEKRNGPMNKRAAAMVTLAQQHAAMAKTLRAAVRKGVESSSHFAGLARAYEVSAKAIRKAVREQANVR